MFSLSGLSWICWPIVSIGILCSACLSVPRLLILLLSVDAVIIFVQTHTTPASLIAFYCCLWQHIGSTDVCDSLIMPGLNYHSNYSSLIRVQVCVTETWPAVLRTSKWRGIKDDGYSYFPQVGALNGSSQWIPIFPFFVDSYILNHIFPFHTPQASWKQKSLYQFPHIIAFK